MRRSPLSKSSLSANFLCIFLVSGRDFSYGVHQKETAIF